MKGLRGDIWKLADADPDSFVVVPTNTCVRRDGRAVMGAGMAKQAAERHPDLPKMLAAKIKHSGEEDTHDFPELGIVCLPTKRDWRDEADPDLIRHGCRQLAQMAALTGNITFYLPLLGCGLGGLSWSRIVRPIIIEELGSSMNTVVIKP